MPQLSIRAKTSPLRLRADEELWPPRGINESKGGSYAIQLVRRAPRQRPALLVCTVCWSIHAPYARLDIAYRYDEGAFDLGRLTGMSDSSDSTAYSYDAHGRLMQEARATHETRT